MLGISTGFIMMHSFHSAPQWGVEETSLFEAPLAWPMSESLPRGVGSFINLVGIILLLFVCDVNFLKTVA